MKRRSGDFIFDLLKSTKQSKISYLALDYFFVMTKIIIRSLNIKVEECVQLYDNSWTDLFIYFQYYLCVVLWPLYTTDDIFHHVSFDLNVYFVSFDKMVRIMNVTF